METTGLGLRKRMDISTEEQEGKCVSRRFVTPCRIATVIDRLFAGDGSIAKTGNTIDGSNWLWVTEANGYLDRRGAVPPWLKG